MFEEMSLREKIGQLILGQAEGYEMSESFKSYIKKYPLCGYRINQPNIKTISQIKSFTGEIQQAFKDQGTDLQAILACDEEGGSLSVFEGLITEFPGNMSLGATGNHKLAYLQGNFTGHELFKFGLNMNFAPVADINLQASNPVIGVRAFGDAPEMVAEFCRSFISGLNTGGVAGCIKHFPGHGNTNVDSHIALPRNNSDLDLMRASELKPFSMLAKSEVDSIMVSHVLYPNLTSDNLPASLSKEIIGDLLREELAYKGVIFTDDLEMKAITSNFSIGEAVRKFILAGGDIALINGSRKAVIEAFESILTAVEEGIISEERIDISLGRIIRLKKRMQGYKENANCFTKDSKELSITICEEAITLVRDYNNLLPLSEGIKILLIKPNLISVTAADTTGGKDIKLSDYMSKYCSGIEVVNISLEREAEIDSICTKAKEADKIVFCSLNCARYSWQLNLLNKLKEIKPVVNIMLRDPYDATFISEDVAVIAAYSSNNNNMKITSELLFGKKEFKGKLPVKI